MKIFLDILGIVLLVIGISIALIGHHYLGPVWFWFGEAILLLAVVVVFRGAYRRKKLDSALRSYKGPGDFGDTNYHNGGDIADLARHVQHHAHHQSHEAHDSSHGHGGTD